MVVQIGSSQWVVLSLRDNPTFLHENEVAPASRGKILTVLDDLQKQSHLQVGLAVVIDVDEHFVKVTYLFEGLFCFELLSD